MKPAFSIVFFTVSSGAGLGLLALLALTDLAHVGGFTPPVPLAVGIVLAMMLVVAGLVSSTLHLANPRNAWRSASRFRTSWLSREAVFAMLLLPVAAAYGGSVLLVLSPPLRMVLASLVVPLAWATLFCTAMIYASLKPIRQWHHPLVPLNYVAHGHFTGALLWLAVLYAAGRDAHPWTWVALTLLVASLLAKLAYYRTVIFGDAGRVTIERAIGGTRMRARLFDVGHTQGTFLTDEFHFTLARRHTRALRAALFAGAYAVPLLWLLAGRPSVGGAAGVFLAAAMGFVCERWLFFAEARHTVRLYHGDLQT